jgi:molybdopterin/thiamine biosynthesis adenylyltransferase
MGVGNFHIADPDLFDTANFNRQIGATINTIGRKKVEVMRDMVLSFNPHANIEIYEKGLNEDNIDRFLTGVNIAIDAIDYFEIDTHLLYHKKIREHKIYAVMSGPIGFSATLHVFDPNGMSFMEFFGIDEDMKEIDKLKNYLKGMSPDSIHSEYLGKLPALDAVKKSVSSLSCSCFLTSAIIGAETIIILLGKRKPVIVPECFQIDLFLQKFHHTTKRC